MNEFLSTVNLDEEISAKVEAELTRLQQIIDGLQDKVDTFTRAEGDRAFEERFNSLCSGEFVNDYTRKGVLDRFRSAATKGDRPDSEIFEEIIGGREDIFKGKGLTVDIPGVKKDLGDEDFEEMTYSKYMREHGRKDEY